MRQSGPFSVYLVDVGLQDPRRQPQSLFLPTLETNILGISDWERAISPSKFLGYQNIAMQAGQA